MLQEQACQDSENYEGMFKKLQQKYENDTEWLTQKVQQLEMQIAVGNKDLNDIIKMAAIDNKEAIVTA